MACAAMQREGTFVRGKKLPPNKPTLLADKTPIAFGTSQLKYIFCGETTGKCNTFAPLLLCFEYRTAADTVETLCRFQEESRRCKQQQPHAVKADSTCLTSPGQTQVLMYTNCWQSNVCRSAATPASLQAWCSPCLTCKTIRASCIH